MRLLERHLEMRRRLLRLLLENPNQIETHIGTRAFSLQLSPLRDMRKHKSKLWELIWISDCGRRQKDDDGLGLLNPCITVNDATTYDFMSGWDREKEPLYFYGWIRVNNRHNVYRVQILKQ